jgi:N-acetyl sugar amidotransferase
MQKTEAIQCSKCVLDNNDDPSLTFNSNGVCNHCQAYEKAYVLNPLSETQKQKYLEDSLEIIKSAKGKYQAILGLSGGVDSSYLVYLAKEWNIRVLLVHFDNGWNSELAVDNINRIVDYTGFNLYTHVVDWEEFKDLQLSYIKSSVLDWEVPTDHLIKAALFNLAKIKGIKSILSGTNHQTEFILPHSMRYNKADIDNINDIHQKFGTKPLKTTKLLSPLKEYLETKKHNIQFHPLLDFVYYNKDNAKETIIEKMGWRDYGGKHYESIFTRFYQGYVLPTKFGVDKRKAHLASLINSGQISKQEAIKELEKPSYPNKEMLENDFEFVAKKFDLTNEELNFYINEKPIPHSHYKQYNTKNLKRFKKLEIYLNPNLYINYLKKKLKTT